MCKMNGENKIETESASASALAARSKPCQTPYIESLAIAGGQHTLVPGELHTSSRPIEMIHAGDLGSRRRIIRAMLAIGSGDEREREATWSKGTHQTSTGGGKLAMFQATQIRVAPAALARPSMTNLSPSYCRRVCGVMFPLRYSGCQATTSPRLLKF